MDYKNLKNINGIKNFYKENNVQDKEVLNELGFVRHPEWDWKENGTEHYKLEKYGKIFRAYVVECNGPIPYISMGVVCSDDGKVERWMDCCSDGSTFRKIFKHCNPN